MEKRRKIKATVLKSTRLKMFGQYHTIPTYVENTYWEDCGCCSKYDSCSKIEKLMIDENAEIECKDFCELIG